MKEIITLPKTFKKDKVSLNKHCTISQDTNVAPHVPAGMGSYIWNLSFND